MAALLSGVMRFRRETFVGVRANIDQHQYTSDFGNQGRRGVGFSPDCYEGIFLKKICR